MYLVAIPSSKLGVEAQSMAMITTVKQEDEFLACTPSAIPVVITNSSSSFGSAIDSSNYVLSAQGIYLKYSGLCTNTAQKNSESLLHKDKTGGTWISVKGDFSRNTCASLGATAIRHSNFDPARSI
ncbi:hypothetical protein TURU_018009 [Turdus rufiventris]|nr:hypothetical protein TURU_018009 [Turdus rufiventris]